MRLTVIKEGNTLRFVDSSAPIATAVNLCSILKDELGAALRGPSAWDAAQLGTVYRESDEDWGSSLDSLSGRKDAIDQSPR